MSSSDVPARPRFRQIRLRTLFLLTAAVAVWVAWFTNRRAAEELATRVKALRPLVRELYVDNPTQIAVVKQEEHWYDENRWELYLPADGYQLRVATREVDERGFPADFQSAPLAEGRQRLELLQQEQADKSWLVILLADDKEILRVEETADWDLKRGSSGGSEISTSVQLPPDKPALLFRRRFMVDIGNGSSTSPNGPANGLVIWIEPE